MGGLGGLDLPCEGQENGDCAHYYVENGIQRAVEVLIREAQGFLGLRRVSTGWHSSRRDCGGVGLWTFWDPLG